MFSDDCPPENTGILTKIDRTDQSAPPTKSRDLEKPQNVESVRPKNMLKIIENTDILTTNGVKKVDNLDGGITEKDLKIIHPLNPEKLGNQFEPKSAKKSCVVDVKPVTKSLVCRPNPRNDIQSKGTVSQVNTKKKAKMLKNEMELRSMRPLPTYFERKGQFLQRKIEGESNPSKNEKSSN